MKKRPDQPEPPHTVEEDVRRELRAHLDMRTDELVAAGRTTEEARREALRAFGDVPRISAHCREITTAMHRKRSQTRMLDQLIQDLGYAARSLRQSPGFALVAVLTLALGIGANTAIFSVVNGVLLRPLPYPDADELVVVWERSRTGGDNHVAWANFVDWRARSRSFEGLATHPSYAFGGPTTVLGGERPARVLVAPVSRDFFDVMGVDPALGRPFTDAEQSTGGDPVAVVSHRFWREVLGGVEDLSSHPLRSGSSSFEVVGVMPAGFVYPHGTDVWVPGERFGGSQSRTSHNHAVVGRLAEGVSAEQAHEELDGITAALKAEFGDEMDATEVHLRTLREETVGSAREPLLMLLAAAAILLLVACTNMASTLLARGSSRRREIAVRASVGASRGRLVAQLLTESVVLAGAGAVAGLALAMALVRGLLALAPSSVPRLDAIGLDATVLGFTALLAAATAVVFGLVPALRASRADVGDALRSGTRGSAGDGRGWLWQALVATEVALAVVLLVSAGLLIRSFAGVMAIDPGFEPRGVLTVDLSVPSSEYEDDAAVAAFQTQVLDEMRALPGVEAAGLVNHLPMSGSWINGWFEIIGRGPSGASAHYRAATAGYFDAMGIPVIRGRGFDASDQSGAPDVAVVNQAAAERFWPGEDPLGQRLGHLANDSFVYAGRELTIVGIVGDVRHGGLMTPPVPEIYVNALQRPYRARSAVLTLRVDGDPTSLAGAVRARIRDLDAQVPVEISTVEATVAASTADRRFVMLVLGIFAAVALILAAVGVYGVVSYSVARRTREMGIRIALGAGPAGVRSLVVRGAMGTVTLGLAVGLLGAAAATRLLGTMLHDISPTDPGTFAAVVALLAAAAWAASFLPALRCSRVDPLVTMRGD